mgnify:CR=1 FL=1
MLHFSPTVYLINLLAIYPEFAGTEQDEQAMLALFGAELDFVCIKAENLSKKEFMRRMKTYSKYLQTTKIDYQCLVMAITSHGQAVSTKK